jgi:hypothetical protein
MEKTAAGAGIQRSPDCLSKKRSARSGEFLRWETGAPGMGKRLGGDGSESKRSIKDHAGGMGAGARHCE